jgi:hypothetical protein
MGAVNGDVGEGEQPTTRDSETRKAQARTRAASAGKRAKELAAGHTKERLDSPPAPSSK